MKNLKFLAIFLAAIMATTSFAQTPSSALAGRPQTRSIPEADMMYKKTIWRTIDLREKQNKPLFADNRQITKFIIEAVKRGELPIYKNDSLTSEFTLQEFVANLTIPSDGAGLDSSLIRMGFTDPYQDDWGDNAPATAAVINQVNEYFPKDLYQLEMKEDVIFDKRRSRMYYEINSITMLVPATLKSNIRGRDIAVGTFRYRDLEQVFRKYPQQARWINPRNDVQQKNLADAFDLRLFNSYITKISNPDNARLEDIYGGPKQGILAAQTVAQDIIEFEYNLWSY